MKLYLKLFKPLDKLLLFNIFKTKPKYVIDKNSNIMNYKNNNKNIYETTDLPKKKKN